MRDLPKDAAPAAVDALDPLSDLLGLLHARCRVTASLEAGGDWALRFPAYEPGTLKFSAVVHGRCWLQVAAMPGAAAPRPVELRTDDCVLLNGPPGYVLASDLALPAIDAGPVFAAAANRHARHGIDTTGAPPRDITRLIGGAVRFDTSGAGLLLDSLPSVIVVQGGSDAAAVVGWVLQQLAIEMQRPQVGASHAASHLSHLLFVQMLRAHLASLAHGDASARGSWLAAVAHPRVGIALGLMHAQPARHWTLDELAAAAHMSRSTFSEQFKALAGRAPMDYLMHWRMQRAVRALRDDRSGLAAIAFEAGYESESAFSHAFKRVMGQSPAHYRRALRDAAAT